jgi:hypothetical protein
MHEKINAPHGDFDQTDQKNSRPSLRPVETEWQVFFRKLAENLDAEERDALPAHIQE